MAFAFHP